jgi:hypothetical protein
MAISNLTPCGEQQTRNGKTIGPKAAATQCPFRVKSGKARHEHMFPALPPEADIRRTGRMSELCQTRTRALQQTASLFNHLVGEQLH